MYASMPGTNNLLLFLAIIILLFFKLAPLSAARIAASAFMNSIILRKIIMFGNSCICMHPEPVLTDIAAIKR
ncbi:hypothetical protein B4098_0197 [Heyndrickxia coagulans]|uniref:Uncharacterized protein n=1 Tax=Heyndrickxia coagulans TaxID=1398 RepID=A0A150K8J7_HEYCO|nr:hypothetical protein B4098_0197 [Heyndrickxia coagulans]